MTREEFGKAMAVLSSTFPSLNLSRETLEVWFALLRDIPDPEFRDGIGRICREEKQIFPGTNVVALIRERVFGAVEGSGLRALARVEEAMFRVGAYRSVAFDDPLIHLAISRMGGWEYICRMDDDEWKFARRDFQKLYETSIREPVDIGTVPKRLPGTIERENSAHGHGLEGVRLTIVGDPEKVFQWAGDVRTSKQIGTGEQYRDLNMLKGVGGIGETGIRQIARQNPRDNREIQPDGQTGGRGVNDPILDGTDENDVPEGLDE